MRIKTKQKEPSLSQLTAPNGRHVVLCLREGSGVVGVGAGVVGGGAGVVGGGASVAKQLTPFCGIMKAVKKMVTL